MKTTREELPVTLERSPALGDLLAKVERGAESADLGGAAGSSRAMTVAFLAEKLRRPLLWVVKDQESLYDACDDIAFFASQLGLALEPLPFPHLETLPYEERRPQIDIRCARLIVWQALLRRAGGDPASAPLVVAPVRSLMRRFPPFATVRENTITLRVGEDHDRERLCRELVAEGYEYRELITGPGEFCARGGIVDIFPPTSAAPYRIEFFGDRIESLRTFDPLTQRSTSQEREVVLLPSDEMRLTHRVRDAGKPLVTALSLFPPDTVVCVDGITDLHDESKRVEDLIHRMYREIRQRGAIPGSVSVLGEEAPMAPGEERPPIPPEELYVLFESFGAELHTRNPVYFHQFRQPEGIPNLDCLPIDLVDQQTSERLQDIERRLAEGERFLLVCDNDGQRTRLEELLGDSVRDPARDLRIIVGALTQGFRMRDAGLCFMTDREVFHRYRRLRHAHRNILALPVTDVVDLAPGDYVVHVDHGIGKYVGLRELDTDDGPMDFLELLYADDDILYVPITQMDRVGRYIGSEEAPPALSKLGSKVWQSTKERAQAAIEEMAGELLELYAERSIKKGTAFPGDLPWQYEFEAAFPFEETPDQIRSIREVKADMEADRPMDRLICGDVGFGKTEVALRAAFKSVMGGKQAAVLVPTTILAQQHFNTFRERVADYPVQVEMLSRFRDPSEQRRIVEDLRAGKIDIVIGTHRLLQRDVGFNDLGLVVIDEEQRFGVRHKERLKTLRRTVDCITMTATPIPRTLYMSLNGVRDMSMVNTPPENRLPIETYVVRFDRSVIESAILREMSRGGQVYFLHNRVNSIGAMARFVRELVPEARVAVGHGQMEKHELEHIMLDFIDRKYDILVSTTIIESGIDIPNVNTIIINRADTFGLAELYQLRGRVGRERHQAYCYLLIPGEAGITAKARRRLLAIQEFNQLGCGFQLALRDLEIRGMGNILGRQQHGHIAAIGFELYNQMLAGTIRRLQGQDAEAEIVTSLDMAGRGGIDPDYIPSPNSRMNLHKRLAGTKRIEEVDAIEAEMADMFGAPPPRARRFLDSVRLRIRAGVAGFERVSIGQENAELAYAPAFLRSGFSAERIIYWNNRWGLTFRVKLDEDKVILQVSNLGSPEDFPDRLGRFLERVSRGSETEEPALAAAQS